jgi:hypothetical protein
MRILALAAAALAAAPLALASPRTTLLVGRPEQGPGARLTSVHLIKGVVPHRTRALVLTDTRCNPDAHGVSHCLNRMRLANRAIITVRHDHRMMDMPCLTPDEHVVLMPR